MAGLSAVFNSPFYWGDISLEETINILEQERPKSYLFRKLKNGSVTLACLIDSKVFEIFSVFFYIHHIYL